jgi:hypothetical protein
MSRGYSLSGVNFDDFLDVNAELFTVKSGDRVTVAVARSTTLILPP